MKNSKIKLLVSTMLLLLVMPMMMGATFDDANDEDTVPYERTTFQTNFECCDSSTALSSQFSSCSHFYPNEVVIFFNEDHIAELSELELSELIETLNLLNPDRPHCTGFGMSLMSHNVQWINVNATVHRLQTQTTWRCDRSGCNWVTEVTDTGPPLSHVWVITSHWHGAGTTHHANQRCRDCGRTRAITWTCPPSNCIMPFSDQFDKK